VSGHDPGGAAREEAARQAVALVIMALALPALVWWERYASGADALPILAKRARAFLKQETPRDRFWIDREVNEFRHEMTQWSHTREP